MEVRETGQTAGTDGRDLVLPERRLVNLNDVRGGPETVLHHQLKSHENMKHINMRYFILFIKKRVKIIF